MAFYFGRKMIRKLPGVVIKTAHVPHPEISEGFGARGRVGDICRSRGFKSVLLVTDETLFGLGLHVKVLDSIRERGIRCCVFHGISSEPTIGIVSDGRKAAVSCKADCVVAIGGGSVLDSSKIIAAGARHPFVPIGRFLRKFAVLKKKTLPLVCVPSTAGTGAECTVGAVVKNKRGVKGSTVIIGLDVVSVILDSELMIGLPASVTAWCGIDALSHGLEGLLADVKSSDEDVFKSRECVRLVLDNLPVVLSNPANVEARQAMCRAALYGGNAINTQLAGYIHAFAHSIGALYHIPHGKAIAWCLLPVAMAQKELCRVKLAELAAHCGISDENEPMIASVGKLLDSIGALLVRCGLEKGCGFIRIEDYDVLIRMIDNDSVNYSPPKIFTDAEIRTLLDRIRLGS